MTGSGIPTPERKTFAWFVTYLVQKNYVVVHRTVNARSAAEFFAGSDLRWGSVRGYKHGTHADEFLDLLRRSGRVAEDSDIGVVFRLFARGRTSALLSTPPVYARYLRELMLPEQVRIEDWFPGDQPIPHALVLSRRHFGEEEYEGWRRLLREMRDDGILCAIYTRYLGNADAERLLAYTPD